MSDPVVTCELQAGKFKDPKHLSCWDIQVGPSSWVKEVLDHIKSPQDMCPLPHKVCLYKCIGTNRDIAHCQSKGYIPMCISDQPVGDITPERVPFSSAKLFPNVTCQFPPLEPEPDVYQICSKSLACFKDFLFGANNIIIINNSHNASSKECKLVVQILECFVTCNCK